MYLHETKVMDDGKEQRKLKIDPRTIQMSRYCTAIRLCFMMKAVFQIVCNSISKYSTVLHILQVVRSLQHGVINRVAGGVCLMALTVCVVEMSAMVKEMHNIISHFSTITPTPHISRPMMEFLSCMYDTVQSHSSQ